MFYVKLYKCICWSIIKVNHIHLSFKPTLAIEGQIQFLDLLTTAETDIVRKPTTDTK